MDPLNQVRSCHLLCPKERYEKEKEHTKPAKISGQSFQFNYRIVKTSCFNENSNNLHSLFHCSKKEGEEIFYGTCENCHMQIETDTCYFCSYCNRAYHKECVESPSIYHSSDHPKHPLQLLFIKKKKKILFNFSGLSNTLIQDVFLVKVSVLFLLYYTIALFAILHFILFARDNQHPLLQTILKGTSIPSITFPGNLLWLVMFVDWWMMIILTYYTHVSYVISLFIKGVSTYHML